MVGENESRVPQAISERKEIITIEHTVASTLFNSKTMKPNCQTSRTLQFLHLKDQRGKLISRFTMKIFLKKDKGMLRHVSEKVTEAEMPGHDLSH